MTKIEITDAMVERYFAHEYPKQPDIPEAVVVRIKRSIRANLDAAMNPPAEPAIVVTAVMEQAGCSAFNDEAQALNYAGGTLGKQLVAAFRAMRALEPKQPTGSPVWNKLFEQAAERKGRESAIKQVETYVSCLMPCTTKTIVDSLIAWLNAT